MSLFVRYAEPWIVLPESRYDISDRKIDKYMDEDFSLYMRVKIFPDRMIPNEEGFAFARSGKHSGISFVKFIDQNENEIITLMFTYWFKDSTFVQITKNLTREEANEFVEIAVINDDLNKKSFSLYVNGEHIDTKEYHNEKQLYKFGEMGGGGFYQFGNGNFEVPSIAMYLECEFDMIFLFKKELLYEEIIGLSENYKNYLEPFLEELVVLNKDFPHRKDLAFFLDFKNKNRYKVWELSHNGNYLSKANLENLFF